MNFDFTEVLRRLGADAAFVIANKARAAGDYLFATLLPERLLPTYDAKSGNMTVRSTMAGLAGMDSVYPPTGIVEASTFLEQTAKIANNVTMPEAALRQLQQLLQTIRDRSTNATLDIMQTEVLNFLNKVVIQPHLDTREYLRGEALVFGIIDWTYNQKRLLVDYGVPAANKTTHRTGNDAYHGTASKFWEDIRKANSLLRYNVRARIAHPETIDAILANTANAVQVTAQEGSRFQIRRFVQVNGQNVLSSDARESVTLIGYDREGEILDPANPGTTIKVPFMPKGKILNVAENVDSGYRVGQGATDSATNALEIGYTHLGPTVEGGGRMGMWSRVSTPDDRPWQLRGEGVCNALPVIEAPAKIVINSTDMPA